MMLSTVVGACCCFIIIICTSMLPSTNAANCTLNVFIYDYNTPTSICTESEIDNTTTTTTLCLSPAYRNTTLCDYTINFALLDSNTENASIKSAFPIVKFDPCSRDFFSLGFHNHPNPIPLSTSEIMIANFTLQVQMEFNQTILDRFLVCGTQQPSNSFSVDEFTTRETYTSMENNQTSITLSFQSYCVSDEDPTSPPPAPTLTPVPIIGGTTIIAIGVTGGIILMLAMALVLVVLAWCYTLKNRSKREHTGANKKDPRNTKELEESISQLIPGEKNGSNVKEGDGGVTKEGTAQKETSDNKAKARTDENRTLSVDSGVGVGGGEDKKTMEKGEKKVMSTVSVQGFVDKIEMSGNRDENDKAKAKKGNNRNKKPALGRQEPMLPPPPPTTNFGRVQRSIRNKVTYLRNVFKLESNGIYDEPIRRTSQYMEEDEEDGDAITVAPNIGYGKLQDRASPSSPAEEATGGSTKSPKDDSSYVVLNAGKGSGEGVNEKRLSIEIPIGSDGYAAPLNTVSRNPALLVPVEEEIAVRPNIGYNKPSIASLKEQDSFDEYAYVKVDY